MIIFYSPHTWKSSMRATCTVCLKVSAIEHHENHHLTLGSFELWEEIVTVQCTLVSYPDPQELFWCNSVWDYMYSHCFFCWPCHYLHYLYTDSETHFKVVVVSETFEGMPLLKVCREQNHCLVFRLSPFSVLIACSIQKVQVIKKPD